jgi:hypothetical protein
MEFKGTQDEWIADYSYESETYISCNGLRIAEVKHYKNSDLSDPSTEEGRANAKLIAAAPKLLEACLMALEAVKELHEHQEGWHEEQSFLEKAINEALN